MKAVFTPMIANQKFGSPYFMPRQKRLIIIANIPATSPGDVINVPF